MKGELARRHYHFTTIAGTWGGLHGFKVLVKIGGRWVKYPKKRGDFYWEFNSLDALRCVIADMKIEQERIGDTRSKHPHLTDLSGPGRCRE